MSARNVQHGTFSIERVFDAPPKTVFDAFATVDGKSRWFSAPSTEWTLLERTFDCRVGGRETLKGRWKNGTVTSFDAWYGDIVTNERLVYTYTMHMDERKISVSLATIEFKPEGKGTRLKLTEQGAFLDGYDDAGSRERGTNALIDGLEASLKRH